MKKLLAIVVCCFVIVTGYIAFVITERQKALKNVAHHNDSWAVAQSLAEYMRLEHRLAGYALGLKSADRNEVRLRLDIVLGRIDILEQGTLRDFVDSRARHGETLAKLRAVLGKLDGYLQRGEKFDVRALLEEMSQLDGPMTAVAAAAAEYDAGRVETQYEGLKRLHWIYTGLAASLIFCGIGLIILLLQHNRLLNRAHNGMQVLAEGLQTASEELHTQNARLAHAANHDALTGLPNRLLFRQELETRLAAAGGAGVAVLLLDLDGFKDVNDTLGHDIGDALLQAVAARLQHLVGPDDLVCRLGGDEFTIISSVLSHQQAQALAGCLIGEIALPYDIEGREIVIATSIGLAFSSHGENQDEVFKHADLALYEAKEMGRGRICIFRPELHTRLQHKKSFEADLQKALVNDELEVYYQPQADSRTREINGYEALLRWNHPARGQVSPVEFIPVAEETGLIQEMGDWILRTVCADAARWPKPFKVAVNLSPVQFRSKMLAQNVLSALAHGGLDPRRLELEITESVLLDRNAQVLETLRSLKKVGIQIAMDDFGTGYSSLVSLRSFPFDRIKIDRTFIRDITTRGDALAIVELVVGVAKSLGMETTAEGVETEEQFECLKKLGCDQIQGYLLGRPMPLSHLPELRDHAATPTAHLFLASALPHR